MFVYFIKFISRNIIKIGAAKNINRLLEITKMYEDIGVDGSSCIIVTANEDADVSMLEKQLLMDYSEYEITDKDLNGRSGYTELRDAGILSMLISDVETKSRRFPHKGFEIRQIDISYFQHKKGICRTNTQIRKFYMDEHLEKNKENRRRANRFIEKLDDIWNFILDAYFADDGLLVIEFEKFDNDFNYFKNYEACPFSVDQGITGIYEGYIVLHGCFFQDKLSYNFKLDYLAEVVEDYRWDIRYKELILFMDKIFIRLGIDFDYSLYISELRKSRVIPKSLNESRFIYITEDSILKDKGIY